MHTIIQKWIFDKSLIKMGAFFLGYWIWSGISNYQVISYTCSVPLCFHNVTNKKIDAPEKIEVVLRGYKNDIIHLDVQHIVAHVQAEDLHKGTNYIPLTDSLLLLPDTIKMIHCTPSPLVVQVSYNDSIQV